MPATLERAPTTDERQSRSPRIHDRSLNGSAPANHRVQSFREMLRRTSYSLTVPEAPPAPTEEPTPAPSGPPAPAPSGDDLASLRAAYEQAYAALEYFSVEAATSSFSPTAIYARTAYSQAGERYMAARDRLMAAERSRAIF